MRIAKTLTASVLAAGMMASEALANAIVSQPPDQFTSCLQGPADFCADNFTTQAPTPVGEITFWGVYSGAPVVDDFEVRFYLDDGGLPMPTPFATRTLVGLTRTLTSSSVAGLDEYRYEAMLSTPFELPAPGTYWIAIFNNADLGWRWETSAAGDDLLANITTSGVFGTAGFDQAFELCAASLAACEGDLLHAQAPDLENGFFSDIDPLGGDGTPNSGLDEQELAEQISFPVDVIVEQVRFFGLYARGNTPSPDAFTIHVYADAGGAPEEAPTLSIPLGPILRAPTGSQVGFEILFSEFEYLATIDPALSLNANQLYWISIVNDTSGDVDDNWAWETSDQGDGAYVFRNPNFPTWTFDNGSLAFELCGRLCATDGVCAGDLDGDGDVDATDLSLLLGGWGVCPPAEAVAAPSLLDVGRERALPEGKPRALGIHSHR